MNALLEQFLLEGRDLIGEATRDLLALERTPDDGTLITGVFRAFHTLKGSSGVFGIQPLTRMLHAAEDILVAVRNGRTVIDAPLTDALLECLDQTARWLDNLEALGTLPDDAENTASGLIDRLRRDGGTAGGTVPQAAESLDVFTEAERSGALEALRGKAPGTGLFRIVYEPDPRCFFNGDDPLKLIAGLPGLAALRISPREDWPALDSLDPFQCNLRIDALILGRGSGDTARVPSGPRSGADRRSSPRSPDPSPAQAYRRYRRRRAGRTAAPAFRHRHEAGRDRRPPGFSGSRRDQRPAPRSQGRPRGNHHGGAPGSAGAA